MPDLTEIIQKAIQIETDGEEYYRQVALSTKNPLAKHTFETLADQEVEHREIFEAHYRAMEQEKAWPSLSELGAERRQAIADAEGIFTAALADLQGELLEEAGLDEAYATAMQMERDTINFYREQLEAADDDQRELYEFLIEQERGHLNILATTEEYLNHTEYWHFKEEQWIVTG